MDYLKKDKLVFGKTYECCARNFTLGVWNGKSFTYIRYKWGNTFYDEEFHWDDGPPYGTVKPIKEVT